MPAGSILNGLFSLAKASTAFRSGCASFSGCNGLNAPLRRSRLQMGLDAILDLLLGSPRHDRIDQLVAAAVLELRVGPSQVLQVVDVVGQLRDIVLHVGTGASAGLSRIGGEDDGLLHANHR